MAILIFSGASTSAGMELKRLIRNFGDRDMQVKPFLVGEHAFLFREPYLVICREIEIDLFAIDLHRILQRRLPPIGHTIIIDPEGQAVIAFELEDHLIVMILRSLLISAGPPVPVPGLPFG